MGCASVKSQPDAGRAASLVGPCFPRGKEQPRVARLPAPVDCRRTAVGGTVFAATTGGRREGLCPGRPGTGWTVFHLPSTLGHLSRRIGSGRRDPIPRRRAAASRGPVCGEISSAQLTAKAQKTKPVSNRSRSSRGAPAVRVLQQHGRFRRRRRFHGVAVHLTCTADARGVGLLASLTVFIL